MKLLIMQLSPTPCHFIPLLGPNILLSTLFPNTLSLYSSLTARMQLSLQYRITCKIIVLYIPIFTFTADKKTKDSGLNSISYYFPPESNFENGCKEELTGNIHLTDVGAKYFQRNKEYIRQT
jgi:hypothetical protein